MTAPEDVHHFWFGDELPQTLEELIVVVSRHNPSLDDEVRERFGPTIDAAKRGEFDHWADSPRGLLSLVLVLDQFPRHVDRNNARQYEGDARALELTLEALDRRWQRDLEFVEQIFLGMPLAHSEDLEMQRRSVEFADESTANAPEWVGFFAEIGPSQSRKYRDVIERFGRFPHRNETLGRESTPEELEFLKTWPERQPPDVLREKGIIGPPRR